MSRLTDLTPPIRQTDAEDRRAALIESNAAPGLFRMITGGLELAWSPFLGSATRLPFASSFDPSFRISEEMGEQLFEGIPTHLLSRFEGASSWTDAQLIRQQLLQHADTERELARAGVSGLAAQFAGEMFSPSSLASLVATGGLSSAYQGVRLANLAKGGLLTGGVNAAWVAGEGIASRDFSARDVAWAGVAGFALHQAGALAGAGLAKAADRLKRGLEAQDIAAAMGAAGSGELNPGDFHKRITKALSEKGQAYYRDVLDPEVSKARIHELIDSLDFPDDIAADLKKLPPEQVLDHLQPAGYEWVPPGLGADEAAPPPPPKGLDGAAPAEQPPPPKKRGDFSLDGLTDAPATWTRLRRSFSAIFGEEKSTTPGLRLAGSAYVEDALLKKGGGPAVESASEWVGKTTSVYLARYYREAETALREWAKATGRNMDPVRGLATRDEFFEEVGKAIRLPQSLSPGPVKQVADLQRRLQSDLLDMAKRHRLKGFDNVNESATYLTRIWNSARITQMESVIGTKGVEGLIAASIKRGSSNLDTDQADKLAKVFLKVLKNRDKWTDVDAMRMFSGEQSETLMAVLKEHGLDDEAIRNIVYAVAPPDKNAGVIARAKRRLDIDENTQVYIDGTLYRIQDLMESNAEAIFGLYTRQILGASAEATILQRLSKHFDPDGKLPAIDNYNSLRSRIGAEMSGKGFAAEHIDEVLGHLDTAHKALLGLRMNPDSKTNRLLRTIRAYNHINVSGGFGIAQIPDAGNLIAEGGFRAMLQQMPAFSTILRRAKDGSWSDEMLEFAELANGLGTDRLTRQLVQRFDEGAATREFGGGGLERRLRQGTRWANDLSFMAPINIGLQKLSGLTAAQRLANIAWSNKSPGKKRLAAIGMSESEWRTVAAAIKADAKFETGILGRRLLDVNIDGWADQDAAAKFVVAIDKLSRRVIQQNDIGQLLPFMTTEVGKTIFQFRTFAVVAWEKQFLHRLQMADWTAFSGAMWGSFIAGLVYAGQKYVESVGRSDAQEYRDKHLSLDRVIKAGVQRGAWSSILPGAIDSVWGATGGEPIFTARNSGLASNWLTGNPTYNLIAPATGTIYKAARGIGKAVRGEGYTQEDARHLTNLLPYRRVFGIQNFIEAVNTSFPEERSE